MHNSQVTGHDVEGDPLAGMQEGFTISPGGISILSSDGERTIGELETIDGPAHNAPRPELEGLNDDELIEAIKNPADGQYVIVRGNQVLNGNGRIKEAQRWGLTIDIPVDILPDDDPMAPWE